MTFKNKTRYREKLQIEWTFLTQHISYRRKRQ